MTTELATTEIDWEVIYTVVGFAVRSIHDSLPFVPCPRCIDFGSKRTNCMCNGKGWLTREEFDDKFHACGGWPPAVSNIGKDSKVTREIFERDHVPE